MLSSIIRTTVSRHSGKVTLFARPASKAVASVSLSQKRSIGDLVAPEFDADFDALVKKNFPGAVTNEQFEQNVVKILDGLGYKPSNTLVATSLCADELARRLEDDFVKLYGNNFNLGGLSGFPFAGVTGFGAMSAHIPDDGFCLLIYAPHVGITQDGLVGPVERKGIELVDTCCDSAVAASNYVQSITDGGATITSNIQNFADFQQGVVQELILPHGKRLHDADNRMIELPYAFYDTQEILVNDIVHAGSGGIKKGLAMLGGIQINTAPGKWDYFHPLRFDYLEDNGKKKTNLLPKLLEGL